MPPAGSSLDYLDRFVTHDVCFMTRTIYLGSSPRSDDNDESGIDWLLAERMIKNLWALDNYNQSKGKDITILLNCIGGEEIHGMAIYDAVNNCKSWVTIRVIGHAMSMGAIILQSGDERILYPHSLMMIHEGQECYSGISENIRRSRHAQEQYNKRTRKILLDRIREKHKKYGEKQLIAKLRLDTWLTPEEAVSLGLADKVIDETT